VVPRILLCIASLWLAACASQFPERRPSLDDPSNPLAPESAVRPLRPTLSAEPSAMTEVPPPQSPPMHHHHQHDGTKTPSVEEMKTSPPRGGEQ
jgi:hypothetical protein